MYKARQVDTTDGSTRVSRKFSEGKWYIYFYIEERVGRGRK